MPGLSHKRVFYFDVQDDKPFTFTTDEARFRIQNNLSTIFLKRGTTLGLEDYWTQVGVDTGPSASTADFNWSPARISVINF